MHGLPFKIDYEIAALILYIITIAYTFINKNIPNLTSKVYKIFIVLCFITAFFNICTVYADKYAFTVPIWMSIAFNMLYLALQNLLPAMWFLYVVLLTNAFEEKKCRSFVWFAIPLVLDWFLLLITPWTGCVFYFDEQFQYVRGGGMNILYLSSFIYMLSSTTLTIMKWNKLQVKQAVTILLFVFSTCMAVVLQIFVPEILVISFATSIACLVIYVMLQNPEEKMDYITGAFNRYALISTLSDNLQKKLKFSVIMVAWEDYNNASEQYGMKTGDAILRNIVLFLNKIAPSSIYRMHGGNVAIVLRDDRAATEEKIKMIAERFQKIWTVGDYTGRLAVYIGCIFCPDDAATVEEALDTLNNTISDGIMTGDRGIFYASDHILNREKIIKMMQEQQQLLEEKSEEADKARKEAEEANNTKSIFLANMSHEIRTPLNAIMGMTELAGKEKLPEQAREYLESIKSSGKTLLNLINDILDLSKIESGTMEIIEEKYYLSSVVHDMVAMINTRLQGKLVELRVKMDCTLPNKLIGDELRFRQVLLNILGNAVKFTTEGHIRLILLGERKQDALWLNVSVEDTGFGIKEEDVERLFDNFARLDNKNTRQIEGTGLGLAICKRIVEQMGGRISVTSKYGEGSTFSFCIPQKIEEDISVVEVEKLEEKSLLVVSEEKIEGVSCMMKAFDLAVDYETNLEYLASQTEKKYTHVIITDEIYKTYKEEIDRLDTDVQIAVACKYGESVTDNNHLYVLQKPLYGLNISAFLNGCRQQEEKDEKPFIAPEAKVLVVDDNAVNLQVAEGLLKQYQIQVTKALNGQECLDMLHANQYHIVFLDHMMPGMDGIETIHRIREMEYEHCKNVPVVALTANAIRGVQEMFEENGFQGYISKPIHIKHLEDTLREFIPEELFVLQEERPQQEEQEMFEYTIEGIDTAKGVAQCAGKVEVYWNLLETVLREGRIKCQMLENYAKEDSIQYYCVEAHALKSVAASIGAAELSALAKEHEMQAKAEHYAFVREQYADLVEQYGDMLNRIEAVLQKRAESGIHIVEEEISSEEWRQLLEKVIEKIDDYEDEDAIIILEQMKDRTADAEKQVQLKNIAEQLKMLDYQAAKEQAETLL